MSADILSAVASIKAALIGEEARADSDIEGRRPPCTNAVCHLLASSSSALLYALALASVRSLEGASVVNALVWAFRAALMSVIGEASIRN